MQNLKILSTWKKINLLPKKRSKPILNLDVFNTMYRIGVFNTIYQSGIFPFYREKNPIQQYELGYNHEVSKNYSKAVKWYRLAAKQSHINAMYSLGILYETGNGVVKNYTTAMKWYHLAALRNHPDAQYRFARLHEEYLHIQEDDQKIITWYAMAAKQGHHKAIIKMMNMYKNGKISLPNKVDAYVWVSYLTTMEMPGAEDECEELAQKLSPIQLHHAKIRLIHLYESSEYGESSLRAYRFR